MLRILALPALLLVCGLSQGQAVKPGEPVRLTIGPTKTPAPSLNVRLLPDEKELTPGNAATLYYRCFAHYMENQALLKNVQGETWEKWLGMKPSDLPKEEIRNNLRMARHLLREAHLASRMRSCDWQIEGRSEGVGLLLPDLQGFRAIGRLLAVQARLEIAEENYEAALDTLRTCLALGRHLTQAPTLIHVLVGGSIANMALNQVEAFVQQPGSPNLYWGLTLLPRPFLDWQVALREEATMMERSVPGYKVLEKGPASADQVGKILRDLEKYVDEFNIRRPTLYPIGQLAAMWQEYPHAKEYLLKQGYAASAVGAMPVAQPVLLFAFNDYRQSWEDLAKWTHVANGFDHAGYKKASNRYKEATKRLDRLFFGGLLMALTEMSDGQTDTLSNVAFSLAKVDRRIAALCAVEAIRLHLAGGGGNLPEKLSDLAEVPAPTNPMTGQAFAYTADKGTARLTGTGRKGSAATNDLVYELTIKR